MSATFLIITSLLLLHPFQISGQINKIMLFYHNTSASYQTFPLVLEKIIFSQILSLGKEKGRNVERVKDVRATKVLNLKDTSRTC